MPPAYSCGFRLAPAGSSGHDRGSHLRSRTISDLTVGIPLGCLLGFIAWFLVRYLVAGIYTVNQNERAVKTSFGRAERLGDANTAADSISRMLAPEERERYGVPQVRVIQPGGPYFSQLLVAAPAPAPPPPPRPGR